MSETERHHERGLARHTIQKQVQVYDASQNVILGQLVNIHSEGLMIVGDVAIKPDHIYQLQLKLPLRIEGADTVRIGADCLWVRQMGESSSYWAGYHIIDLSETAKKQVDVLIEQLGE